MHEYEGARGHFYKALKLRPDDGTYLIWLGVTYLYLGIQIGKKLQRNLNKTDSQFKVQNL